MLTGMDSQEESTGYSQRSAYDTVFEELRKKLTDALSKGSKRLLSTYLQTLLAYPDGCTRGETVFDPESGEPIVQVPPLSEETALSQGEGPGGPGGQGAVGQAQGAGLRHPHGAPGTSPKGWMKSSLVTVSAWR